VGTRRMPRLVLAAMIGLAAMLGSLGPPAAGPARAAALNQDSDDRLGTTWAPEWESSGGGGGSEGWTRRGKTNISDVTDDSGRRYVREGTLSGDGRTVTGKMTHSEVYTRRATIARAAAPPPPAAGSPGSVLYALSPNRDGVFQLEADGQWTRIGGPAGSVYAGGGRLFATDPDTGDIYRYTRFGWYTGSDWVKAGGPGKAFAVDGSTAALYGISPDGSAVYEYHLDERWTRIGGPAGSVYAGGGRLLATDPDTGDIYRYTGRGWVKAGGPGREFVVACDGTLYGHSPDGSGVFRYQADEQWVQVGGPAARITVGCSHPA
jgi:hypothetical protein